MPPTSRPLPRFIAEPPHETEPYGRWSERLEAEFSAACARVEGAPDLAGEIAWFPQRSWGGRVYVPAAAPAGDGELFGFVSYRPADEGADARDFIASADYTEETAAANPNWRIDLSDEPVGRWSGPGGAEADVTLVWGMPLVAGAAIATGELDDNTVDQCETGAGGSFTLLALDAVSGFGDTLYLEVAVWDRSGRLLATESLYEEE